MRAIVYHHYGSSNVLQLEDVPKPSPREREVLVQVCASSLNATDAENLRGTFVVRIGGPLRPKYGILGSDVAGRVESVGSAVTRVHPGDEVFGDLSPLKGHFGAFAEYVCVHEDSLTIKPTWLTFREAAAVPSAAIIALQALRNHRAIRRGESVLVNGAGGNVGTFAVQIAKALGAEVTGVDHRRKLDLVRALGADHAIDYTQDDFTQQGKRYDLILDVVSHRSVFDYRRALRRHGLCILVGGSMAAFFQALLFGPWNSVARSKRVGLLTSWRPNQPEDMRRLLELLRTGAIRPIIDKTYPLSETADAFRYLDSGFARGKIVIAVRDERSGESLRKDAARDTRDTKEKEELG